MNVFQVIQGHYSLFGSRGVWLAAWGRLQQKRLEIAVAVPGIKFPVHLRLRTSDVSTFRQVLVAAGYECEVARLPRTIIDAGANIGLTSIFYANKFPDARILAVEPEPSNYRLLKTNVAPYPRIIPIQGAIWKENRQLTIINPNMGDWGFQTTAGSGPALAGSRSQVTTCGMTIDTLMKQYEMDYIDLLKVDIEGAEKEVFENAERWIEHVGAIAIELHDGIKPDCSRAFADATRGFQAVLSRGETIFVGRPGCVLGEQAYARKAAQQQGPAIADTALKLPCRIVGIVDR